MSSRITRVRRGSGHAYALDGARIPSVTTILSHAVAKPALQWWAAKETAAWAATHAELIEPMGEAEWIDHASKASDRARNKAAAKGTDVHSLAQAALRGEPVDVPDDLAAKVRAAVDFMDTWQLREIASERPCASSVHKYGGTFDVLGELTDGDGHVETWLLDWKTGKGPYAEQTMQLAAYAACDFYQDESGHDEPMPTIDRLGFVMLGDDTWDLVPVVGERDRLTNVFLNAMTVSAFVEWTTPNRQGRAAWPVLGEPKPRVATS